MNTQMIDTAILGDPVPMSSPLGPCRREAA
jgi:hypothetical protein